MWYVRDRMNRITHDTNETCWKLFKLIHRQANFVQRVCIPGCGMLLPVSSSSISRRKTYIPSKGALSSGEVEHAVDCLFWAGYTRNYFG